MAVQDFAGHCAFITGGGSGIGAATARLLASRGAKVIVTDRDRACAHEVAALLPHTAQARALDAKDRAAAAELFANLAAEGILPDILVNSAGVREIRHPLDLSPEEWDHVLAVNLTGSFAVAQAFARQLRDLGRPGAIVNIASTSGRLAAENRAPMCRRNTASWV